MAVLRNIVGEGERNVGQWLRLAASPILGMPRGENHMCNVSLMKNTAPNWALIHSQLSIGWMKTLYGGESPLVMVVPLHWFEWQVCLSTGFACCQADSFGIKESQVLQKSVIWKMLQTFNRFVIRAQYNENLCPSPFFSNQCSVCVWFNLIEKFSIQNLKTDGDFLQP